MRVNAHTLPLASFARHPQRRLASLLGTTTTTTVVNNVEYPVAATKTRSTAERRTHDG